MAAQFEYEYTHEMSPLHEWEADPFFGKAFRRIGRFAGGLAKRALPILKKLAPIAAKLVAGAIPGVGMIAGPLAGKLVGALTQEQQHELEAILHEAASPEVAMEMEGHMESESEWEFSHEGEGYSQEAHLYNPEAHLYNPESEAHLYNPESEAHLYNPEGEAHLYNPELYNPEAHLYNPEGEMEWEGYSPEMEGHPEAEVMMHPEAEGGLPHSEAAHQEAMLMEQIAHEAAHTANEAEAEALAGSLIPIALRGARSATPMLRAAAPSLARATGRLVGALRQTPATRMLVPTVPTILRRTNATLTRAAASGTPITPRLAVRTMANQTYRVMSSPVVCIKILVRSNRMRRQRRMRTVI